ncbi:MAG: tail fiber domain-containing protein [Lysobacterales bacterium]
MRKSPLFLILAAALTLGTDAAAQSSSDSYAWERPANTASATVVLTGPNGQRGRVEFASGQAVKINASVPGLGTLADGTWKWSVVFAPQVAGAQRQTASQQRQEGLTELPAGWPESVPSQSGLFLIQNGRFAPMDLEESASNMPEKSTASTATERGGKAELGLKDQVIADDLIVDGSACVGTDCVNNESFGFDTLRLKENNTRINFEDTSVGGFPSNDWEITANDSASGGLSHLSILDRDTGRRTFTVEAAAPSNALYVDSSGRIGLGTDAPVQDLHIMNGNTPTVRFDQNGSSGFTPQVWDIGGNEAQFFVRDVTFGSRFPFRIRPGAPTSSIDITANGEVGIGMGGASAALQVRRNSAFTGSFLRVDLPDDSNPATEERRLELDNSGNLFVGGTITQLSSRYSKENFVAVAGSELLSQLRQLPIFSWNYIKTSDDDRHIGPVAEDFYRTFGFGMSERSLAPADMAGVALAASQALSAEIDKRDQRIAELEARLERLEAALLRSDATAN